MAIILMIYISVKNAQVTARLVQVPQNAHHAMMDIMPTMGNAFNVILQSIAKLAEKKDTVFIAHHVQIMPTFIQIIMMAAFLVTDAHIIAQDVLTKQELAQIAMLDTIFQVQNAKLAVKAA